MVGKTAWLSAATAIGLLVLSRGAAAQGHDLHYAHAGALLAHADAELRILYGATVDKEFDPALARSLADEVARALDEAARRADRAALLLPEKEVALEPEMRKVVEAIKRASETLAKLRSDLDAAAGGEEEAEESDTPVEEDKSGDEPAAVRRDWDRLKMGAAWLGVDLGAARAEHGRVMKKLKIRALPFPPKPKGARP